MDLRQLAVTLDNFATFNAVQKQLVGRRTYYEEALRIDQQLAGQNPAFYLPNDAW